MPSTGGRRAAPRNSRGERSQPARLAHSPESGSAEVSRLQLTAGGLTVICNAPNEGCEKA